MLLLSAGMFVVIFFPIHAMQTAESCKFVETQYCMSLINK